MRRNVLIGFTIAAMFLSLVVATSEQANANEKSLIDSFQKVSVAVDGTCEQNLCAEGINLDGTTYVPIRVILETMGATVNWDQTSHTVVIEKQQQEATEKPNTEHSTEEQSVEEAEHDLQFAKDTEQILNRIDLAKDLLYLFDQQLQLAKEYYKELGDDSQVSALEGKHFERTREHEALLKAYLSYQKKYPDYSSETEAILKRINELKEILDQYKVSVQSLQQYTKEQNNEQMRLYLMTRKHAYEHLERLEKNLNLHQNENMN